MTTKKILYIFFGALLFFCAFNWLMPITDPVESNYALTAKEMLLSGDWVSPRIYGHFWYDKPALIYWLLIISYKIFGICDFAARFPSAAAGAVVTTFAAWFYGKVYRAERGGYIFSALLATSALVWAMSKMVLTDAVLFAVVSMALGLAWLHIVARDRAKLYAAYALLGIGMLDKGPVALVVPVLVIFIYAVMTVEWTQVANRKSHSGESCDLRLTTCVHSPATGLSVIRRCFSIPGLILFVAVGLPWYVLMYQRHGMDFVNGFLGLNNFVRATVSEHPEDNHFYYYLYMIPASLLPWTFLFLKAIWAERAEKSYKYLLAWILGFLFFFTAMATKYPTYCMPVIFPALMLAARYLERKYDTASQFDIALLIAPLLLVCVGLNVAAAIFMPQSAAWYSALSLSALCGMFVILKKKKSGAVICYSLISAVLIMAFAGMYLPGYACQRSAKAAAAHLPKDAVNVACYGDFMTSAVYYSGLNIVELGDAPQGAWSGKYVMPFETPQEFFARNNNQDYYVLIRKSNRVADFYKEKFSERFNLLYADRYYFVLKRSVRK